MDKKNKIITFIVIAFGVVSYALLAVLCFSQQNSWYNDLLTMLWISPIGSPWVILIPFCLIYGLIRFISGIIRKRDLIWSSLVPVVLSIVFFIGIIYPGSSLYIYRKDKLFEKNFVKFEKIVNEIKTGQMKPKEDNEFYSAFYPPPDSPYQGIIGSIIVDKNKDNVLVIRFASGGPLPYTRGGHIYIANDNPDKKMMESFRLRKIKPCWYRWFDPK